MNIYKMEKILWKMHKVASVRKLEEMKAPEIIIEAKKREIANIGICYERVADAYDEFVKLKESSKLFVNELELKEKYSGYDELTDEVFEMDQYVYEVCCKQEKRNVLRGLMFDTKCLAYAYMYKFGEDKHPIFDKVYKWIELSPEERLLKVIYNEETWDSEVASDCMGFDDGTTISD